MVRFLFGFGSASLRVSLGSVRPFPSSLSSSIAGAGGAPIWSGKGDAFIPKDAYGAKGVLPGEEASGTSGVFSPCSLFRLWFPVGLFGFVLAPCSSPLLFPGGSRFVLVELVVSP